jgi:3-hydroxy-9,10-secoandrosta-1,3,5(10)-triene-9,17-dione monooxygenase
MSIAEAVPTAEELIERAKALVPTLREKAEETERARRVLPEHFEALSEAGILRMCAPKRYGGYEMDFQTQTAVLALLARGCPSTSWVATILSALAWVAGVFPDEAQEEIFADGDPRTSGALSPTGTGTPKDGGLVVNGRWPYNTGCHGATWTYLHVIVPTGDGEGMLTGVFVPSSELTILDDWDASGMAGTGSNTVVAENLFVPGYRTQPVPPMIEAQYPRDRHNAGNPYFNLPLVPVLSVNAGGTPVGTAEGALEVFRERLPGRAITYTNYEVQSEAPITHLQVGEAMLKIDSANAHVRLACEIMDGFQGEPLSVQERVKARAHIGYSTGQAREAVEILFSASGASAIQFKVPIQRYHRDIQALANHAVMAPSTNIELYGRVLCGLEPNTPLF